MNFREIDLSEALMAAIEEMGFEEMTEIQAQALPKLREGLDVIGRSQTGTGKTLAFALPAIEKIEEKLHKPQVLVLLPTRELALQVAGEFEKALLNLPGIAVSAVFGGASMEKQIRELRRGAQIVVGTPGRIMDHMRRGILKLDGLKLVVLDEADEMLNMGFREDIEFILDSVDHPVQTALFSATMPEPILRIAELYQHDPHRIEIKPKFLVAEGIEQRYYTIDDSRKFEALTRLLDVHKPNRAMIFCNTKMFVDEVTANLQEAGYSADRIHGDMRQESRLAVLNRFMSGQLQLLVATDVAARGIDVNDVDIVFNYDVPDNEEYYVHRIGRTGRAGKTGLSLTLARRRDRFRLKRITEFTKHPITKALIPGSEDVNALKIARFKTRFLDRVQDDTDMLRYLTIVDDLMAEDYDPRYIAAVLLRSRLPLKDSEDLNIEFETKRERRHNRESKREGRESYGYASGRDTRRGEARGGRQGRPEGHRDRDPSGRHFDPEVTKRLFINVGIKDGAKKRDILGAVCGESGISSANVGAIEMFNHCSFVNVDVSDAGKVVQRLEGKTIKDRKVHVEYADREKKSRRSRHG